MAEKRVQAPDAQTLSRKEIAKWLGIGVDAFDALVRNEGWQPTVLGAKSHKWSWMDAVCLLHIMQRKAVYQQPGWDKPPAR